MLLNSFALNTSSSSVPRWYTLCVVVILDLIPTTVAAAKVIYYLLEV